VSRGYDGTDYEIFMAENNDLDGDGVENRFDNCPFVAHPSQEDADEDGEGDVCDTDTVYGTINGDILLGVTVEIYKPNCGVDILVGEPVTNSEGYYAFAGLENSRYLLVPNATGYSFSSGYWVDIPQPLIQSYDFTATVLTCDDVDRFLDNSDGTVTDCQTNLI
jgi:hypothetical protein